MAKLTLKEKKIMKFKELSDDFSGVMKSVEIIFNQQGLNINTVDALERAVKLGRRAIRLNVQLRDLKTQQTSKKK